LAEVGIRELKAGASRIIEEVESGTAYVVTKRGRPAAVILSIDEAEDLVLANAEELVAMRRRARDAYRRGRTQTLADLD